MSEQELSFVLNVNLFGPYRITKAFAPLLLATKERVVNISSLNGIVASPMIGAYSMSKHGIEAFSDALGRAGALRRAGEYDRAGELRHIDRPQHACANRYVARERLALRAPMEVGAGNDGVIRQESSARRGRGCRAGCIVERQSQASVPRGPGSQSGDNRDS